MNKRLAATAAILLIFFSSTAFLSGQASPPQHARLQETAYPIESETPSEEPTAYEGPEVTPTDIFLDTETPYPRVSDTLEAVEPTNSLTIQPTGPGIATPTAGRDLFSTEDAEIKNARVTPRASETTGPSRTPHVTVTPIPSPTPTPVPPFLFDRSWFLAGLLIPAGVLFIAWLIFQIKNSGEFKN